MNEQLTYAELPDEDKLLMDDLFIYKSAKIAERDTIRNKLMQLRQQEQDCTTEIMNLSQRKIGEKFEIGATSAKPLHKRNRENIEDRLSKEKIKRPKSGVQGLKFEQQQKIMSNINEKKICSEDGQQSKFNCEFPIRASGRIG